MSKWPKATLSVSLLCLAALGCSAPTMELQEAALLHASLGRCDGMGVRHQSGQAGCKATVENRFGRCVRPFLAHESTPEAFSECLGFIYPPPEPERRTLVACDGPLIHVKLSLSIARSEPWPDSRERTVLGRSLHVARVAVLDEKELRALRLEDRGEERVLVATFSPDAAKRLAGATASNVGNWLITSLNGAEVAAQIASEIGGGRLILNAARLTPAEVCAVP